MDYNLRPLAVSLIVGAIHCAINFGNNDKTTYSVSDDTGLGPICYACNLMVRPDDCMQIVQCGRDEMCMLHELMGVSGGEKHFLTRCESVAICQSLQNHAKRESRVFCHNCCLEDRCNNHCGVTPTQTPTVPASALTTTTSTTTTATTTTTPATTRTTTTTTPVTTRTTTTTTPATTRTTTSSTPATTRTTTTTTTTTTTATTTSTTTTPRPTVQAVYTPTTTAVEHRAIVCYQCNAMVDPGTCNRFVKCASGEVCILHHVRSDTGQMLYNSGCIQQSVCNVLAHLQRNATQVDYCDTCCSTDLCNNKCFTHVTTTHLPDTTTHALDTALIRSRCEHNGFVYIPYVNLCVRLVDIKHSFTVAASYCQYYGGMIAIVDTQGKYDAIQSLLKYANHFATTKAYIGAHSSASQNHILYWPNGKLVTGIWFDLNFNHPTADCVALDGSVGFTPKFVACNNMYNFICTKEL